MCEQCHRVGNDMGIIFGSKFNDENFSAVLHNLPPEAIEFFMVRGGLD